MYWQCQWGLVNDFSVLCALSLGWWPTLCNDSARRSQTVSTFCPSELLLNHVLEVSPIAVVTPVLPVALEGAQFFKIHRELSARRSVRVTQTNTRATAVIDAVRRKKVRRPRTSVHQSYPPDCIPEGRVSSGVINIASVIGGKVDKIAEYS